VYDEIIFRPRMGYLIIYLIVMIIVAGIILGIFIEIGLFSDDFLFYLMMTLMLLFYPLVIFPLFLIRVKYIFRTESLIVRRYLSTYEIRYRSITHVEEVTDHSVYFANITPSVPSSKQIWIWYSDKDGSEQYVNICPRKKEEFLSQLRYRVDPKAFEIKSSLS